MSENMVPIPLVINKVIEETKEGKKIFRAEAQMIFLNEINDSREWFQSKEQSESLGDQKMTVLFMKNKSRIFVLESFDKFTSRCGAIKLLKEPKKKKDASKK